MNKKQQWKEYNKKLRKLINEWDDYESEVNDYVDSMDDEGQTELDPPKPPVENPPPPPNPE